MMHSVAITGIGVVSPIGNDAGTFAGSLKAGLIGAGEITRCDLSGFRKRPRAFEVRGFNGPKHTSFHDRHIQFALAATEEALADSGIDLPRMDRERIGIAVSSSKGGMETFERFYDRFQENRSALLGARLYANFIPNISAQWIARRLKLSGPAKPAVAACATGLFALMEGVRMIEQGEADCCIAGATDASITRLMLAGYQNMGVLSEDELRPFDARRDGFLVGEGAGIVILERLDHAKARGAERYARVLSHAYGFEASDAVSFAADGVGLSRCLESVMRNAGLTPDTLHYVNLHGTGTKPGDLYETRQFKTAFGKQAHKIPMSSTKSQTGHLLGASGVIEVIACLIAMRDGFVPPTAGLEQPDPECDLDYTPLKSKSKSIETACSVSMGFGGQLGAMVLGR